MQKPKTRTKRIFVSLPEGVWKIINRDFKEIGETESEILRNMIISYLTLRGYFVNEKGYEDTSRILEGQTVLEKMITSLAEILEEKGTINYNNWESRINKKVTEPETES